MRNRSFIVFILILCLISPISVNCNLSTTDSRPVLNISSTHTKANEALEFCNSKNFNTDFCILIDMSLHSGVKRFFVWDFKKDTIRYSFLVGHGCCDNPWSDDSSKDKPVFSNVDGSHCSALGKYKLGERGYSNWGINIKYLMHGLEPTNSNALGRTIVFHSWDEVPEDLRISEETRQAAIERFVHQSVVVQEPFKIKPPLNLPRPPGKKTP